MKRLFLFSLVIFFLSSCTEEPDLEVPNCIAHDKLTQERVAIECVESASVCEEYIKDEKDGYKWELQYNDHCMLTLLD